MPIAESLSRARFTRDIWTVLFVVVVATAGSVLQAEPSWGLTGQTSGLALLYLITAIRLGEPLERASAPAPKVAYFLIQLVILSIMAVVFARHRTFGATWLFFMPLVSQSRMLLKPIGTTAVCLASLAIMALHIHAFAGLGESLRSILSIVTAVAFVLVFTDVAMRESAARADSQRLSEELEQANRQLGAYAVQAEELATARERTRMAREIHDSVGHSLTAVHMQIEAARAVLDRDPEKTREALGKAQRSIQSGLTEIRHSVATLRADPLDGRNLHGALSDLADVGVSSGHPVRFRVSGRQRPLSQAVALTLFRSAQEGLTNARKHARARHVTIELDYGRVEEGRREDRVRLRVIDDGVGTETTDGGFGLVGLRERVRQLDGHFDVETTPGDGLTLAIEIPTPANLKGEP